MRFFFYGTLLDYDVIALVLGRRLPPAAFVPASLPGHARRRAKSATYPIVVRDPRGAVPGGVVRGLSARDVALWLALAACGSAMLLARLPWTALSSFMKWAAKSGTSSLRSRRAGRRTVMALRR